MTKPEMSFTDINGETFTLVNPVVHSWDLTFDTADVRLRRHVRVVLEVDIDEIKYTPLRAISAEKKQIQEA